MKTPNSLYASALSSTELEQLRPALAARYPNAKNVLGSQLGAFVRGHLANPDLKSRFGGLKEFAAHCFPVEIVWRGRRGLDDLYDISFATEGSGSENGTWRPVPLEPSLDLWSAVTNPSIYVQFAWSAKDRSLLQAPIGVPLTGDLAAVEKLTGGDYQNIAKTFVTSLESIDAETRARAIESSGSSTKFTALMREKDLLAEWEKFRIDRAKGLFADRLAASGAEPQDIARWSDLLRWSGQEARSRRLEARSRRLEKTEALSAAQPLHGLANREHLGEEMPDSRAVAIKAMEFLSDSELGSLSLPLGAVMRALGLLVRRS